MSRFEDGFDPKRTNNNTDRYSGDYRGIDRRPLKPDKMDMGGSEICKRSGGWGIGRVMAGVGQ